MTDLPHPAEPGCQTSLVERAQTAAAAMLGIRKLDDPSALLRLAPFDGVALVNTIHRTIAEDYDRHGASANKNSSKKTWRWPSLQPSRNEAKSCAETKVERAIADACIRLGRHDWGNQIPTASGLLGPTRDRHRSIDLVHQRGENHFELIELKIESNTPLSAAIQILSYACLWLIARNDRPARPSVLLDADHIDLRVLAPAAYYGRFALADIESALNAGAYALGERHGVTLTFAFDLLDDQIRPADIPDDATLLALLDRPRSATAPAP